MNQFSMPYEREQENERRQGGTSAKELWKPLPEQSGTSHGNNVLIPLLSPQYWRLFNPTPDMVAKYDMVGTGGLTALDPAKPIYTFYFKVPHHVIPKFNRPDGSIGYATVLCPLEFNKYLVEFLGCQPLFNSTVRCAHCEEEQRHWDAFNARWAACGVDNKTLSKEGYFQYIDKDPELSAARKAAKAMQASEKYVIPIFDHDKQQGVRPLDEGQTCVEHQVWIAPKTVKEKLIKIFLGGKQSVAPGEGLAFFAPTPQGFPIISIEKDTKKCTPGDMKKTEYDALFVGSHHPYDEAWLAYLQNQSLMVDPSDFIRLISYEEGRGYVAQQRSAGNDYSGPPAGLPATVGMPPVGVPGGMPSVGASPVAAHPGVYATPPVPTPAGVPPMGVLPVGAPPMTPPMGAPPAGAPPVAAPPMTPPTGAPPVAAPPVGPPPAMPATAEAPVPAPPTGAPVPAQPPAPVPASVVSPVPTIPAAQGAPPDRSATPPAGDAPPAQRRW